MDLRRFRAFQSGLTLLFLCVFVLRIGGAAALLDLPQFAVKPHDVAVRLGDDALLHCEVQGGSSGGVISNILWKYNDSWLNVTDPATNALQFDNGSLYLRDVVWDRSGSYACAINLTGVGVVLSQRARLSIARLWAIADPSTEAIARRGGVARLECSIKGTPRVSYSWTLGSLPLVISGKRFFQKSDSGILHIYNVTDSDVGSYKCHAENLAGSLTSAPIELRLVSTEQFLGLNESESIPLDWLRWVARPQTVVAIQGEDVLLECGTDANTPPKITWKRDPPPRPQAITARRQQAGQGMKLKSVQPDDSALYSCEATTAGNKTYFKSASLTVLSPPNFVAPSGTFEERNRGETVRFACRVAASPALLSMHWYKNGEKLSEGSRVKMFPPHADHSLLDPDGGRTDNNLPLYSRELVISEVQESDSAIYQCIVEHVTGSSTSAGSALHVQLDASGNDGTAAESNQWNLTGSAVGDRKILLQWRPAAPNADMIAYFIRYERTQPLLGQYTDNNEPVDASTGCTQEWCTYMCCDAVELLPDTEYRITVTAISKTVFSRPSEAIVLRTGLPVAFGSDLVHQVVADASKPPPLLRPPVVVMPPMTVSCDVLSSTAVRLRWTPPPLGHRPVVKYTVEYNVLPLNPDDLVNASLTVYVNTSKTTWTNNDPFEPGHMYVFRVRSWDVDGHTGPFSIPATACQTLEQPPTAPTAVTVQQLTENSVQLRWQAPAEANGALEEYGVVYRAAVNDTSEVIHVKASVTSLRVVDLVLGAEYIFFVRARNKADWGPASDERSLTLLENFVPATTESQNMNNSTMIVHVVSYAEGIIAGICIAVMFLLICAIVLVWRHRYNSQGGLCCSFLAFPPRPFGGSRPQRSPGKGGNSRRQVANGTVPPVSHVELQEVQTLLPKLVENQEADAKGGENGVVLRGSRGLVKPYNKQGDVGRGDTNSKEIMNLRPPPHPTAKPLSVVVCDATVHSPSGVATVTAGGFTNQGDSPMQHSPFLTTTPSSSAHESWDSSRCSSDVDEEADISLPDTERTAPPIGGWRPTGGRARKTHSMNSGGGTSPRCEHLTDSGIGFDATDHPQCCAAPNGRTYGRREPRWIQNGDDRSSKQHSSCAGRTGSSECGPC